MDKYNYMIFKEETTHKLERHSPVHVNCRKVIRGTDCNICCPRDGAYFVSGRRTVFMYDVPNKRQSGYASQEQKTCSFHGVNSGIILEITPVVNS